MRKDIVNAFPIKSDEYTELDDKFGKLCYYAAHQLKKKNSQNNFMDDIDDIYQELVFHLMIAGSYYKRQVYIENCFSQLVEHVPFISFVKEEDEEGNEQEQIVVTGKDKNFVGEVISELWNLWKNRTRHGANRQKFGGYQEKLLGKLVRQYVPSGYRPSRKAKLVVDSKFSTYCKAIVWNGQKSMGKKITREKAIRNGQVSISEYDYLVKA
jgi:hypothetical protein